MNRDEVKRIADEIDAEASIAARPGQLERLERIASRLRVAAEGECEQCEQLKEENDTLRRKRDRAVNEKLHAEDLLLDRAAEGDDAREVPGEVWVARYKAPYRNVATYIPRVYADKPDNAEHEWIRVPIHGAPAKHDPGPVCCHICGEERECLDVCGECARDPDCAECDKPYQWDALHAAIEECHDALERKQGEVDRLRGLLGPPTDWVDRVELRRACKRRMPLDGADAQALEHAITITERERDAAQARVAELEEANTRIFREASAAHAENHGMRLRVKELERIGSEGIIAYDIQRAKADRLEKELQAAEAQLRAVREWVDDHRISYPTAARELADAIDKAGKGER